MPLPARTAASHARGADRRNLFLVPLDDRRQCIATTSSLRTCCRGICYDRDVVPELHRRASGWYERNGEPSRRPSRAGRRDFEQAAIWSSSPPPRRFRIDKRRRCGAGSRRFPGTWLGQTRPQQWVRRGIDVRTASSRESRHTCGRSSGGLIDNRWRSGTRAAPEMVVVDEDAFRGLPGFSMSTVPAKPWSAATRPAPWTTPGGQSTAPLRTTTSGEAGASALLALGDGRRRSRAAHRWHAEGLPVWRRPVPCRRGWRCDHPGRHPKRPGSPGRGNAHLQGLRAATEHVAGAERSGGHARGHEPARTNELDAATQHLLTPRAGWRLFPRNRYRWRVAMARVRRRRDLGGALDLIKEAHRLYVGDFSPMCGRSRRCGRGCWPRGVVWTKRSTGRANGLSADDDVGYLREFEHLTLARVLLARHQAERPG